MTQKPLPSAEEIAKLPPDGGPHFNRLIFSSSPYLRQHARNPVDWYPWGEEAFQRAMDEQRPIFLSVGYSTCHWCHVMARESFEDDEIAEILNTFYVPIKVDKEERPDVDRFYMRATQLLTRRGGWPNSVWLNPARVPFYAGTYFPPEDRKRQQPGHGTVVQAGFPTMLTRLAEFFRDRRPEAEEQAARFLEQMTQAAAPDLTVGQVHVNRSVGEELTEALEEAFDSEHGGFQSRGPKFPPHASLRWLFYEARRRVAELQAAQDEGQDEEDAPAEQDVTRKPEEEPEEGPPLFPLEALGVEAQMAVTTLRHMAMGGLYDHIGGGFHRYSTDGRWFQPHFEKMLSDNGQLAALYAEAYQLTREPLFEAVARGIAGWAMDEMRRGEQAFFSAVDADSAGEEGVFYVWQHAEVIGALGPDLGARFCELYGIVEGGNWKDEATGAQMDTNIPYLTRTVADYAAADGRRLDAVENEMKRARETLYALRSKREKPECDDKILSGWNGLMIGGLAKVGGALEDSTIVDAAMRAADFVLSQMVESNRLYATWREDRRGTLGFLDDYAFFANGLLDLYEVTGIRRWLEAAVRFISLIPELFPYEGGGFTFASIEHDGLPTKSRTAVDGASPSGNAMTALAFARLAQLDPKRSYSVAADELVATFSSQLVQYPRALQTMVMVTAMRRDHDQASEPVAEEERFTGADLRLTDERIKIGVYLSTRRIRPERWIVVALKIVIPEGMSINDATDEHHPTAITMTENPAFALESCEIPPGGPIPGDKSKTGLMGVVWVFCALKARVGQAERPYPVELNLTYQLCDPDGCRERDQMSIKLSVAHDLEAPVRVQRHRDVFRNMPTAMKRLISMDVSS